jgi:hypothetical protein
MSNRDEKRAAAAQIGLRERLRFAGRRAQFGLRDAATAASRVAGYGAARGTAAEAAAEIERRPVSRLFALLQLFKAARRRRDDAALGSAEWDAADVDITELQRQIFDLTVDDQSAAPAPLPPRMI